MALTIAYNVSAYLTTLGYIFTTTDGGTVFSANQAASTSFDLFSDTAVANDAIYFGLTTYYDSFSNIQMNIGTGIAGTGIVLIWEYSRLGNVWKTIPNSIDETNGLTTTGVVNFRFPLTPHSGVATVNGVNTYWVRCRIVSLTTISEGGRTQSVVVKRNLGRLDVSGTTDIAPATFSGLVTLINSTYPELIATKVGNVFWFTNFTLVIGSRLVSTKEVIFLGNGNPGWRFYPNYLTSGTKYDAYTAINPSNYFFDGNIVTAIFICGTETKIYGGVIQNYLYEDGFTATNTGGNAGGLSYGASEFVQVQVMCAFSGYFSGAAKLKNVFCSGEFTTTGFPSNADALDKVSVIGGRITLFTAANGNYQNIDIHYPNQVLIWSGSNVGNQKITFTNPVTQLPKQTSLAATSFVNTGVSALTDIVKVYYYDDSSATFTDYTAQAQSVTANDVPLSGDVNDIYYFLSTGVSAAAGAYLTFSDGVNQDNDYVYQWQIYTSSGWETTMIWDVTKNFTIANKSIYIKNSISYGSDGTQKRDQATVAINGVAGFWVRLKIITKGTANPTFSKVRGGNVVALSDWLYSQLYTYNATIQAIDGTKISNANIIIRDVFGTQVVNIITDANGNIAQQTLKQRAWYFDPINYPTNYGLIGSKDYSPFTIYISASGYENFSEIRDINSATADVITLKPVTKTRYTIEGKPLRALTPESGSSSKLLEL